MFCHMQNCTEGKQFAAIRLSGSAADRSFAPRTYKLPDGKCECEQCGCTAGSHAWTGLSKGEGPAAEATHSCMMRYRWLELS